MITVPWQVSSLEFEPRGGIVPLGHMGRQVWVANLNGTPFHGVGVGGK